jgi:hypothetical protein
MAKNQRITESVTRRGYLSGTVGFGIGLTGINNYNTRDTVEIVVVRGSDGPRLTKKVSADWYHWEKHVERVAEKYREQIQSNDDIIAVGIGSGLKQIDGRNGGHLRVYVDPNSESPAVPDHVEDVPTKIIDYKEAGRASCDCNHAYFDPIPGAVTVEPNGTGAPAASTTCKVEKNSNFYMLTVSHLWTCDFDDIDGWNAHQYGSYYGTVAEHDHYEDYALTQLDDDKAGHTGFDNTIEDYSGMLSGHVTYDGLTDFMGSDADTVHQHGITTCKRTGKILDRDFQKDFPECNPQTVYSRVLTDMRTEPGDSGGPVFWQYTFDGCLYIGIIGHTLGGNNPTTPVCDPEDGWSETVATPAYILHNDYNINFDPNFGPCA